MAKYREVKESCPRCKHKHYEGGDCPYCNCPLFYYIERQEYELKGA
ncbi:MAG: hypothetical protein QXP55_01755 [Nitrososphaerales archaeon]